MRIRLYAVLPVLLCIISYGAFADTAADLKRASSLLAAAKPNEAITALQAAIPAAEQSKDAKLQDLKALLAKCYIAAKSWDKADSLIDALIAAYPADPATPRLLKGGVYQGQGKSAEALDEVKAGLIAAKVPVDTRWVVKLLDSIQSANRAPSADTLEELGDCYRMANDFAKAAKSYRAVFFKHKVPDEQGKRIRRWLIKCDIRSRQWARVEKEIDAIAAESPESAAWSYYSLGEHYLRFRDYRKAIASFAKAIPPGKTPPKSPSPKSIQTALVDCYTGAKQWDNAVALLKKLAAQYPKEAAHWHESAGAIYQGQKKYPEAIAELKQAIDPPTAVTARKRLGECYRDSLRPAEAAPLIMELAVKHPKDGPYLPTIAGKFYQGLKEYDKAIATFKYVVANYPDARWQVWDALVYMAECMYPQGKGEEALAYIKDFYAKHPDRPMDFAIAYGRVLMDIAGKHADAAEVLAKAIADHPNDPLVSEILPRLIAAYTNSKQIDRAADILTTLSKSAPDPRKGGLLMWKAGIYFAGSKYREAAEAYKEVIKAEGASPDARAQATYQLAICYQKSGLTRSAREYMLRVSEKYPDSEWAKKARGMLYVWDTYGTSQGSN